MRMYFLICICFASKFKIEVDKILNATTPHPSSKNQLPRYLVIRRKQFCDLTEHDKHDKVHVLSNNQSKHDALNIHRFRFLALFGKRENTT